MNNSLPSYNQRVMCFKDVCTDLKNASFKLSYLIKDIEKNSNGSMVVESLHETKQALTTTRAMLVNAINAFSTFK